MQYYEIRSYTVYYKVQYTYSALLFIVLYIISSGSIAITPFFLSLVFGRIFSLKRNWRSNASC